MVAAAAWASTYLGTAAREGLQVLRRRPWEDLGAAASEDVGVGGGRQVLGHGRFARRLRADLGGGGHTYINQEIGLLVEI